MLSPRSRRGSRCCADTRCWHHNQLMVLGFDSTPATYTLCIGWTEYVINKQITAKFGFLQCYSLIGNQSVNQKLIIINWNLFSAYIDTLFTSTDCVTTSNKHKPFDLVRMNGAKSFRAPILKSSLVKSSLVKSGSVFSQKLLVVNPSSAHNKKPTCC